MTSASEKGLRIAFLGTADFAVPTLRALAKGPDQIVGVFTPPDRPAGRGRRLRAPAVKVAAQELGLALFQPERVSKGPGYEQLGSLAPDLLFVAAFGEILSEEALSGPKVGAVNLHASLLPRCRGAAPIQRALMAGERVSGVTVQWMAREMDAGDIILQRSLEIGEEEDFGGLHDRLAALGAAAGVESVALIRQGAAPRIPQDDDQATYAPPIRREELVIDWRRPAGEVACLVRALSPRPGARTSRAGEILKVLSAGECKKTAGPGGMPGEIMELRNDGFSVTSGDGFLSVKRVQPAGRKVMPAADYLKGYRLEKGERLGA
ncbi:MAG TPA: methionyl-tRNA formyltransferase [Armatimonadota bacterium]|nr:methionyl-tRNA formyltransferase [Armatimonadota bacterium]